MAVLIHNTCKQQRCASLGLINNSNLSSLGLAQSLCATYVVTNNLLVFSGIHI